MSFDAILLLVNAIYLTTLYFALQIPWNSLTKRNAAKE